MALIPGLPPYVVPGGGYTVSEEQMRIIALFDTLWKVGIIDLDVTKDFWDEYSKP